MDVDATTKQTPPLHTQHRSKNKVQRTVTPTPTLQVDCHKNTNPLNKKHLKRRLRSCGYKKPSWRARWNGFVNWCNFESWIRPRLLNCRRESNSLPIATRTYRTNWPKSNHNVNNLLGKTSLLVDGSWSLLQISRTLETTRQSSRSRSAELQRLLWPDCRERWAL